MVLCAVMVLGATGNVALSRGMKGVHITLANWTHLFTALLNPWVIAGICMLICFMAAYLTALSWADLTYVLPATALSYIIIPVLAVAFLHENVSVKRWMGILLITAGVGFVAGGPSLTTLEQMPGDRVEAPGFSPVNKRPESAGL
jgi:drug/metabolite transporter (DMT)-like permease